MVDDGRVEDVTQVRRAATRSRTTTDQRLKPSAAESGGLGPGEPPQAHQFGWGVSRADRPVPNLRDEGVSAVNSEAAKTAADRRFGLVGGVELRDVPLNGRFREDRCRVTRQMFLYGLLAALRRIR